MTDFPAVVYLTAQIPCEKNDNSEKDSRRLENDCIKRFKSSGTDSYSQKKLKSFKRLLEALNGVILKKMDKIEGGLDTLSENFDMLEEKVDILSSYFDFDNSVSEATHIGSEEIAQTAPECRIQEIPVSSKVTYITLNSEDDFPQGSWLGFESKPDMRVRCQIPLNVLEQLNCKCATPEKLSLTLLDHLFDKETQACSNISGTGKHKKKKLNPLLIYGIKCHLMYRFDVNEDDWTKIKIHIDSKCRTAFRNKIKGMPVTSKEGCNVNFNELDFLS